MVRNATLVIGTLLLPTAFALMALGLILGHVPTVLASPATAFVSFALLAIYGTTGEQS